MIVARYKGLLNREQKIAIRDDIRRQVSEGLLVHDDSLEITFVEDICPQCGNKEFEEVKAYADDGDVVEQVIICDSCGFKKEVSK